MSPKRGCPLALPWCAPLPPHPQGRGAWGDCLPKKVSSPGSHSGGTGEGEGLSGREAERGHLRGAPRVEAAAWDGLPPRRTKKLHPSLPTSARARSSRQGQQRTHPPQDPRISPQGTGRVGGGGGAVRGESLDKVSCTGRGTQHHQLSQWGCVFGGKVGGRAPLYL